MQIANRTFSPRAAQAIRLGVFLVVTAAIWIAYFWWRTPVAMLGLKAITHLPPESNQVALTFDDGPHPLTTPLLLASLKRANVKATFFVVGEGIRHYPQLAARIRQDGHHLANHSENHRNLTRISSQEYSTEIDSGFTAISNAGAQTRLFRPPGGGLNQSAIDYIYRNGHTLGWWSNNVGDWAPQPAWKIVYGVTGALRAGDILLLHDAATSTPQAIPSIVREARKRGLEFVPMPESLDSYATN
jgi:peptidoglycan/xylan/chitin deacetylase (PgdA/CDA1 family)